MDKFYIRSEDYQLADKLLRVSGEPLAVWLTDKDDLTTFHLIAYGDDGLRIDGYPSDWVKYQSDFFEYCQEKQARFLLPKIFADVVDSVFADVVDSVVNDKLIEKIEERDRTIQDMQVLLQDVQSMHALAQAEIGDQHRKIKMLEDNLDRARSQYLEQLRAIIQMLEPLATHEDKTLYLSHFGKAAMVYLIQRVIYANIKKLDPKPPTYDNDLLN